MPKKERLWCSNGKRITSKKGERLSRGPAGYFISTGREAAQYIPRAQKGKK